MDLSPIEVMNLRATKILSGNLLDTYFPFELQGNLKDNVTVETKDNGCFFLKNSYCYFNRPLRDRPKQKSIGVLCVPIGYLETLQIIEEEKKFNYYMMNIVNLALNALSDTFGNLEGLYVTCERPGAKGEFFRDLENSAAYELRFFVQTKENDKT